MITAAQLRAARGLVDWTRNELAKAANISPETVKNIEHGIFRPQEQTAEAIVRTFAAHGVEFTDNEGVRLRKDNVLRYEGSDGFKRFMDDVYETARTLILSGSKIFLPENDGSFCMSGLDDRFFSKYLGEYFIMHTKRMNELKKSNDFKIFLLVKERLSTLLPEELQTPGYREFRQYSSRESGNVPFYLYGNKLAVMIFEEENNPQIVVISSALVAKAYREQFKLIWDVSEPIARTK